MSKIASILVRFHLFLSKQVMALLRERLLRHSNTSQIEMVVSHQQEEVTERILIIKQITMQVLWKTVVVTLKNQDSILRVSLIK